MIKIQHEDFDAGREIALLQSSTQIGAVLSFVGTVRSNDNGTLESMWLEHYPVMTQNCLERIAEEAKTRWSILNLSIIHRIGHLNVGEQIVFVGVASAHRQDAFFAGEFIVDLLKTRAPFWKKEYFSDGRQRWVDAKNSDEESASRWCFL